MSLSNILLEYWRRNWAMKKMWILNVIKYYFTVQYQKQSQGLDWNVFRCFNYKYFCEFAKFWFYFKIAKDFFSMSKLRAFTTNSDPSDGQLAIFTKRLLFIIHTLRFLFAQWNARLNNERINKECLATRNNPRLVMNIPRGTFKSALLCTLILVRMKKLQAYKNGYFPIRLSHVAFQ